MRWFARAAPIAYHFGAIPPEELSVGGGGHRADRLGRLVARRL
ncbi:MAG: hypothetical protein U1F43_10335 [Myxococcota bacterium]